MCHASSVQVVLLEERLESGSVAVVDDGVGAVTEFDAIIHYRHRAGLKSLLQQHYLYGRGMAQVLSRRQPPGTEHDGASRMLKANGQKVENQSSIHVLRRGAIAAGRLRGLLDA